MVAALGRLAAEPERQIVAGPSATNTTRTVAATLQNFATALIGILSDPLFVSDRKQPRSISLGI